MAYRIWLFVAGVSALLAVLAAAHGAHALGGLTVYSGAMKSYEVAQQFHMLHAIAILGVGVLFAATDTRRSGFATAMLHIAATAFLAGILLFSGGIYHQVLQGAQSGMPIVPVGGVSFMVGWAALALSAFGFRGAAQAPA